MRDELLIEARKTALITQNRIQLTIPSILAEGEEFSLKIAAIGADALPLEDFPYTLSFESPISGLPKEFSFSPEDKGIATIDNLIAEKEGVIVIKAKVLDSGMHGGDPYISSNPAWVEKNPAMRLYWGDIHIHTKHSNCWPWSCLPPAFCYEYAKEVSHLDFSSITDHLRGLKLEEGRWDDMKALAKEYYEEGKFIPMLAFESSHAKNFGGDNIVYFKGDSGELFWPDREDMKGIAPEVKLEELWEFLDGKVPYITIPHHTARVHKNRHFAEDTYSKEREPLFEIFSGWGSSEKRDNIFPLSGGNSDDPAYFVDALKAGCRYGVVGASDDHATLPGGQSRHRGVPFGLKTLTGYHHKGVTAVFAKSLNRENLWDALIKRRTYASTLTRLLALFKIGDAFMGEEIEVSKTETLFSKRTIEMDITPYASGKHTITIMRNGEEMDKISVDLDCLKREKITFEDNTPLDKISISNAKFYDGSFTVYYARIEDGNCYTQWISPIWLNLV